MEGYFAYIRVSTQKQGETGSSLAEQRDAITVFSSRNGLSIAEWFEETETAAKQGRGEFSRMMRALRTHRARGVIFHKIDRGARNLKDWNAIQELIEFGIDVRFAHESLDMQTRGGRLTADLLAVIASDYIRNLKEEVRKGIRGRLKQGIYPLQAPLGYLDAGGGKPKTHDPIRAPLIRQAFELYGNGRYCLRSLADEMYSQGLRTRAGTMVGVSNMSAILRRKFYMGLIEMRSSRTIYQGVHEPIVSATLFNRVQAILNGKLSARPLRHDFLFRRLLSCAQCGHSLIGERQKGHVYYRCHEKPCGGNSIREEVIHSHLSETFRRVQLTEPEAKTMESEAIALGAEWKQVMERKRQAEALAEQNITSRLSRLTDALLDGLIDKDIFEHKKRDILTERMRAKQDSDSVSADEMLARVGKFLELAKSLCSSYEIADTAEKREMLRITTSNFKVDRKKPCFKLRSPYSELANRPTFQLSPPTRDRPRTSRSRTALKTLLKIIVGHTIARNELMPGVKFF